MKVSLSNDIDMGVGYEDGDMDIIHPKNKMSKHEAMRLRWWLDKAMEELQKLDDEAEQLGYRVTGQTIEFHPEDEAIEVSVIAHTKDEEQKDG